MQACHQYQQPPQLNSLKLYLKKIPVLIAKIGEWDIRSAVAAGQGLDLISYCIKIMELATRFCARSNKGKSWMGQFVGIYDFKNFSFSQVRSLEAIQVIMQACQVFDSNYPEMLGQGFVVNGMYVCTYYLYHIIYILMEEMDEIFAHAVSCVSWG